MSRLFERDEQVSQANAIRGEVIRAWNHWQSALNYFENVSDPELVDYAIYELEAKRRFYMYLLKKAQEIDADYTVQPAELKGGARVRQVNGGKAVAGLLKG